MSAGSHAGEQTELRGESLRPTPLLRYRFDDIRGKSEWPTIGAVPNDFQFKAMNAVHRLIRKVSAERLGWTVTGMRALELTTVGRRTGRPHAVMLTSPIELNGRPVIVASRGGDDHHPAWYLNLRDHPAVRVRLSGRISTPMFARVATARERAELWPRIVAGHPNYAAYQAKTSREIPVVVLEAVPAER